MKKLKRRRFQWLISLAAFCLMLVMQSQSHAASEPPANPCLRAVSVTDAKKETAAPDGDAANDDVEGLDGDGLAFDNAMPASDGAQANEAEAASALSAIIPEPGIASDDVLRMQLRLKSLGYRLAPVTGVSDEADATAITAFVAQNPLADSDAFPGALFSPSAAFADATDGSAATSGSNLEPLTYLTGLPLPWSDVCQRLTPDVVYPLTLSASGIVFHMRYAEGNGHAELEPELAWDDATLINQLDTPGGADKLPVVLSIGALHIAASIAHNPFSEPDADGMHRYCLYFTDSGAHLCNIVDAEHQRMVRIAAGLEP